MRTHQLLLGLAPLVLLGGCVSSEERVGRVGQGQDYSRYVFSMYDQPQAGATSALPASFPMNVAVAEVGQLQPDPQLLEKLRKDKGLFARVEPITGISSGNSYDQANGAVAQTEGNEATPACPAKVEDARLALRRLQRLARDTGMDYLLITGVTVDSQAHSTPLSALELTIIGAFVAPSEQLTAQGQASAALIDLRADRIVFTTSAAAQDRTQAPPVAQRGAGEQQARNLRGTVYQKLGEQFIAECSRRAGFVARATSP
jgi:hypothetical protein